MAQFKQYRWCKVICIILIISFISFDIAWAYPADSALGSYGLSLWSILDQPAGSEAVKRLALSESVFGIGQLVFGLSEDKVRLKPGWLKAALGDAAGRLMADIDVEHIKLARFTEGGNKLEAISDKELNDKSVPGNAVVLIPYRTGSHRRVVLVALRDNVASSYIIGYELPGPIPSACIARFVDEGYIEEKYNLSLRQAQEQAPAPIAPVPGASLSEPAVSLPPAVTEPSASPLESGKSTET